MNSVAIQSIHIHDSEFLRGMHADHFVDAVAGRLANFVTRVADVSGSDVAHYICSSSLDFTCSGGWFDPARLCATTLKYCGVPCSFSNALQCATWGFMLRQHMRCKPEIRHVVLSIVDANPLDLQFWDENSSWGRTGHRLTQLHLELCEATDTVWVSGCNPQVMLYDYARQINRLMGLHAGHTLALPFFEAKMRKGLRRSVSDFPCLADHYEEFGHLCGSDPWMAIARQQLVEPDGERRCIVSSIASQGYACFLSAQSGPWTSTFIEGHA
ncbi:hypothetical protein NTD86_09925 [Pseudomonas sp. 7P_10.2_Bac1]|uniref:hypothetical protein n=1 Tax=Pseudomonas sp. 7P_10.2_Bac1 TaxID=2971614 RepID=UPI0021C673C4|nr:hypothetical protein [Pseudomonas sp. 7P_10.2_Bac1]MCU1727300.1 hypothetical protein [Pseudomonas sp. 7P_10.2_Bac1]